MLQKWREGGGGRAGGGGAQKMQGNGGGRRYNDFTNLSSFDFRLKNNEIG